VVKEANPIFFPFTLHHLVYWLYRSKLSRLGSLLTLNRYFCSESLERRRSSILDSLASAAAALEKRGSVCLNKCLREVGARLEGTSDATSPINVTANPLENPVHFGRKAPQATIVVSHSFIKLFRFVYTC